MSRTYAHSSEQRHYCDAEQPPRWLQPRVTVKRRVRLVSKLLSVTQSATNALRAALGRICEQWQKSQRGPVQPARITTRAPKPASCSARCAAAAKPPLNRSGAGAAALTVKKEAPVAVAQETRETAALVCVAAEGTDHRGLLPPAAEGPAGRRVGGRRRRGDRLFLSMLLGFGVSWGRPCRDS